MDVNTYLELKRLIISYGFERDIVWAETVGKCECADDFFNEYAFVICNSGMRAPVAVKIFRKINEALAKGKKVKSVFKHKGKARAIQRMFDNREAEFRRYQSVPDNIEAQLTYFQSLSWIGPITKYHLAKNLGWDVSKPDRHLVRIAASYGMEQDFMCAELSKATGDRVNTVDYVIWRAASLGLINTLKLEDKRSSTIKRAA